MTPVSIIGPVIGSVTAAVVVIAIAIGALILTVLWCGKRQRCITGGEKSAITTEPVYEVIDLDPSSTEAVHVTTNMSVPLSLPPPHETQETQRSHIEVVQNPAYDPIAPPVELQENLAYSPIAPH